MKGQLLFEIDPRSYRAAVELAQGQLAQANGQLAQSRAQLVQAKAQLASAEANQRKAQLDEDRYVPLAQQQRDRRNAGPERGGELEPGPGRHHRTSEQLGKRDHCPGREGITHTIQLHPP